MWPQISQGAAMRRDDICIHVGPANVIADRNSASKAVWRARIVLATADGHGTNQIMRLTGKSKPCVWRWQERYVAEGVEPLVRRGQQIRAGQAVARIVPSHSGIETGFALGSGNRAYAQGHGGYREGQVTQPGQNFRNLIGRLGAK